MKEYLSFKLKLISVDLFEAFLESDFDKLTFYKKVEAEYSDFSIIKKYFAEVGPGSLEDIFGKCESYSYSEDNTYEIRTIKQDKIGGIVDSIMEYNKTSSNLLAISKSDIQYVLEVEKTINGRKCLFNFEYAEDRLFKCIVICKYENEWEKEKARETVKLASATLNRYYSLSFDTVISKSAYDCIAEKFNSATLISHTEVWDGDFIYNKDKFLSISTLGNDYDLLGYLNDDNFPNSRYTYFNDKYISKKEIFRQGKNGSALLEIVGAHEDEFLLSIEEKLKLATDKKYIMFTGTFAWNEFHHNIKIYLGNDGKLHAKFFTVTFLPKSINIAIKLFSEQIAEFGMWPKVTFDKVKFKYLDLNKKGEDMFCTHGGVGYEMY